MTADNDGPGLTPKEFARVETDLRKFFSPDEVRRRELIRSVRPEWEQLGRSLFDLVHAAGVALGADPSWVPAVPFEASYPDERIVVQDSSPGAADREANHHPTVNPHNERVIKAIGGQVAATLDHITGLGILLATTGPIRPAFVTARAVLVAGTRTVWLADAALDATARVTRAVNLELDHIKDTRSDLRDDSGETAESQLAELDAAERQLWSDGDQDQLHRKGKRFQPAENSGETMAEEAAPELGRAAWRMLSSSAHTMDRGPFASLSLNQIYNSDDERIRRVYAAGGIYPGVILAFSGLEAAANYLGGDSDLLNDVLQPLHAMWERGTMDSNGEKKNAQMVDDYLNRATDA